MESLAWIVFSVWAGSVIYRGYKYYIFKKQEKEMEWE